MKSLDDYFLDWEHNTFGYGYGTGESQIILSLRLFFESIPESGNYDFREIEKKLGGTITWLFINILCKAGIIDYGTSSRFGWLSDSGKKLQSYLLSKSTDQLLELIFCQEDNYIYCYKDHCNCSVKCKNPFW